METEVEEYGGRKREGEAEVEVEGERKREGRQS